MLDSNKEAFRHLRKGDRDLRGNFNFLKFYVISHYPDFIRRFGAVCGVDTEYSEVGHKTHIKEFYRRTNKRSDYMNQIFNHDIRAYNMLTIAAMILRAKTSRVSNGAGSIDAQATSTSQILPLTKLKASNLCPSKTDQETCKKMGKNP